VIIVLGEAIVAVATGVADTQWQWWGTLTGLGGFIVAVSLWRMYFERADSSVINWALRGNKQALLRSYIYGYSHFFVFAGIVATGVGIQSAIEAAAHGSLSLEARAVLCGGLAVFLLGLTAVQWAAPRSLPSLIIGLRLLATLGCVVGVWLGGFLAPVVLVGALTATLIGLANFEASYLERLAA
jgi:low temperature requirement protein LtrA